MKLTDILFRYRLLPSRYLVTLNHNFEVRRSVLFGLMSDFDHINPMFVSYLKRNNVNFRLVVKRSKYGSKRPHLGFWSKEDYEFARHCEKVNPFYLRPHEFGHVVDFLREHDIPHMLPVVSALSGSCQLFNEKDILKMILLGALSKSEYSYYNYEIT